jgi:hypothetical protein
MEDVDLYLRNIGVQIWRKRASGRTEWASVVWEGQAKFKGL